jgi:tetratricopeptide (TPR) repeat protein
LQQHKTLEKFQKEATIAYNGNKFEEALTKYKEVVKIDTQNRSLQQAYSNMATCAHRLEKWEELVEVCTKLIDFGQTTSRTYFRRG